MYSAGTFFAHTAYETLQGGRIQMRPPCRQPTTLWPLPPPSLPPLRSGIAQAIEAEGWWRNLYLRHHIERRKPCAGDNGESLENLENV